jgi:3-methylcrotonyl-CoA carboxylase alpha subunit
MDFEYVIDDECIAIRIERQENDVFKVHIGDEVLLIDCISISPHSVLIQHENLALMGHAAFEDEKVFTSVNGTELQFMDSYALEEAGIAVLEETDGVQSLTAPMPGSVVKLMVSEGDTVEKNQICVVVEAMKMENELRAAFNGKVTAVHVSEKQQVDGGQILVELEADIEEKE